MTGVFVISSRALSTERDGESLECSVLFEIMLARRNVKAENVQCLPGDCRLVFLGVGATETGFAKI